MEAKDNIELARKLIECFNKYDVNQFDNLIDPNVQYHELSGQHMTKNLQLFKQAEQEYINGFPNKKTKIDHIVSADDNQVVICWTTTATHKGTFQGLAPSNKEIKISGISIWRFSNNKLVEAWQIFDRLGLLEQIGALHMTHPSK